MSDTSFPSDNAALWGGAREALGVPAAVLAAGFLGYGSLAAEHGFSIAQIVVATVVVWALPGQLILVESYAVGASAAATIAAVVMSSARFLPMTMTLVPMLRDPRWGRRTVLFVAQFVSMTGWAVAMQRCPDMPQRLRIPYYAGFALTCMAVSALSGAIGHGLTGAFPPLVRLGVVFLTPVYFFVILIGDVRTRLAGLALACGAVAGPLIHLLVPHWSVVLAGFAGGTAAYFIQRHHGRRRA